MRTATTNPFSPGSDSVPAVWAGRSVQLSDWRDVVRPRRIAGLPERGRTILGEPGLGKSTLVRRIAQQATAHGDWTTPQLRIPSGSDPLKLVASALLELADQAGLASSREKSIATVLSRVQAVAVSGFSLTLRGVDGPEPYTALTDLLTTVGTAAMLQGDTVALVHIDEVQNISAPHMLSQLLIALGDAISHEVEVHVPGGERIRRTLPIAVYLTGLPDFEDMAGAMKGATFARRFKTTTLEPLADDDLAEALQEFVLEGWGVIDSAGEPVRIHMASDAAARIIGLCCGEPFLFQLAGEQAWYAGQGDVITREDVERGWQSGARREARAHVERILNRLPRREREFLFAMARLDPADRTATRIAKEVGQQKAADVGPTAQRLDTVRGIISRGKPYAFRHRAMEALLTSKWPEL